jgi:LPS export ABC transporter protein LptC
VGRGFAGCVCCILVVVPFLACSRSKPPGAAVPSDRPTQITRHFTTAVTDSGGGVRYKLRAEVARAYKDEVTRADSVQVDFYDHGQKVSVLRALQGFVDHDGRLRVQGDVVVTSTEGTVLSTQELYWDRAKGKIRADGDFRLVDKGEPLTGTGLTTDPNLSIFDVDSNVSGVTTFDKKEHP